MNARQGRLATWSHFLHAQFLWFLVGVYALAAFAPHVGQLVCGFAQNGRLFGYDFRISAPAALLGFLLFVAGLAVKAEHLRDVFRHPKALGIGLAASIIVPVLVLIAAAPLLSFWSDPGEVRALVVGLAVVAAMPVAGSSAGWSRAVDGDCALSLGLVLLSTLLSPFTTPLALHAAGVFAPEGAGTDLMQLAGNGGAGMFVALWVVLPVLLGLFIRWVMGAARTDAASPVLKFASSVVLLVLCYSNASTCLPAAVANPDWDFLALVVVAAGLACVAAFAAGFGAAQVVSADPARRASLVFGVGMANNGAGLALAAGTLAACPMALLPVVAINLLQHIAAGVASSRLERCKLEVECVAQPL
jgi:BASS family bile acid:Na+ symporter